VQSDDDVFGPHAQVVSSLMPIIEQSVSSYPPATQVTIVAALSQIQHYSESEWMTVLVWIPLHGSSLYGSCRSITSR